jgi:hypothetical protein
MIIKLTIGRWRFTFSMAPITKVIGVDSTLTDGNHILMWDFDTDKLEHIELALRDVQHRFELPSIRISQTGKEHGYHAICLVRMDWRSCVAILGCTHFLDWNYFKYGIYRGHFTLRISPKCFRKIKYLKMLRSNILENATIEELASFVKYETLEDGWHSRKLEVKLFPREEGGA